MAREFLERKSKLEENGIINVLYYFRDKFELDENKIFECTNCELFHNHKHVYKHVNNEIVSICCICNKRINNLSTQNVNYRKQ